jgi:hypothetical protein
MTYQVILGGVVLAPRILSLCRRLHCRVLHAQRDKETEKEKQRKRKKERESKRGREREREGETKREKKRQTDAKNTDTLS